MHAFMLDPGCIEHVAGQGSARPGNLYRMPCSGVVST